MATDRELNDDTRDLANLKTILTFAALPSADANRSRALKGIQSQADLSAAKAAASLLTTDGMKELTVWLEGQIGRRDAF